jgi:tryptophanyl-tRNA synthetase
MRILSGIQPSGTLHIGNYFGMMKPAIELQEKGDAYLFIADYHSLTTLPDAQELRTRVLEVAVDFLACGIDTEKTVFFRQSDVHQVTELTWILNCFTPTGLLERCHSFKDKVSHGISPNNGLFSYPVLMASDILIYRSHLVPVGKDQKQHLEVTRDIAQRFNARYGDIFVIPEEQIRENVAVVPGVDGQKMSKTYGNTIELFGPEKALRKKVMSIVTDSKGLDDPKDPNACNVFALYRLFASPEQITEMEIQYCRGGFGYGHAKQALFDLFWSCFEPMRKKRTELLDNLDFVSDILRKGGEKAKATAEITMRDVRTAVGLR